MASKDEIFEQLLLLGFEFEVAVLVIEDSTVSTVEAAIDKAIILQQTQTQTAQVTPPTKSVSSGDVLDSMIQEQNLNPSIQAISHDSTDHDYVFVDSTQSPLQETRSVPVNTNQPIVSQQPKAEIHISRISQPYFHRSLGSLAVLPGVEQIVKSKLANEPSTSQGDSTSVVSASTADTERFSSKPTYLGHSMKETLRGRHYFAVPRASFQTDVSDMAFRVQKALNISSLDALCIISKESYRVDQICYEAEKDPIGYLARYGLCALEPEGPVEVEPNTCFICLRQNPEELIQHECGNRACTDCWLSLVTSSLDADSSLPICCHPACHRFLQPAFCQAFVNPAQAHELENKYMRAFKKAGFPVRSCPNPSCEIVIIGQNIDEIKCDCGFCGCLQCGASPGHGLMTCKSFAEWNDMMREGQKKSEAIIKSRQCPRCSAPQVKSKISSWMTCFQCMSPFCWICLGPLSPHHSCSSLDREIDRIGGAVRRMRNQLLPEHSALRYFSHRLNFELTKSLMEKLNRSQQNSSYLLEACEKLMEAQTLLAFGYADSAMGHGHEDHLNMFVIERLEFHVESLARFLDEEEKTELACKSYTMNLNKVLDTFKLAFDPARISDAQR